MDSAGEAAGAPAPGLLPQQRETRGMGRLTLFASVQTSTVARGRFLSHSLRILWDLYASQVPIAGEEVKSPLVPLRVV